MADVKILMVCLGNICRSPLAEGILREKARQKSARVFVQSAGTGGWHTGEPPHHLSQKVAAINKVDISGQRARKFRASDILDFDFVYCMDQNNLEDVRKISGKHWIPEKAGLILDLLPELGIREVPDPYYGGFDGYIHVYNLLDRACDRIIENLQSFEDPGE